MLYFFYGQECPHCHTMLPIVDKLIEEGVKIEKLETWHNQENEKIRASKDTGVCGGVPFFFNEESSQSICGATDEKTVRKWASGDKIN